MVLRANGLGRARAFLTPIAVLALAGCHQSGLLPGEGPAPPPPPSPVAQPAESPAAQPAAIDLRRAMGPDYCPSVRVREGTETMRRHVRGREEDPAHVIWQASIGETARECLYDGQGNLTLRVGVSGRVLAGPQGGPTDVTVPVRVAVIQHPQTVLASDIRQLSVTIPSELSTTFTEVRELTIPSPGQARNYLIFVGFDEGGR